MDASYLSILRSNDFRCVFRYYYDVNANTDMDGWCFAAWKGKKEYYLPKKREKFSSNLAKKRLEHSKPLRKRPFLFMPNRQNSDVSDEYW